jgi:hypothetical protein
MFFARRLFWTPYTNMNQIHTKCQAKYKKRPLSDASLGANTKSTTLLRRNTPLVGQRRPNKFHFEWTNLTSNEFVRLRRSDCVITINEREKKRRVGQNWFPPGGREFVACGTTLRPSGIEGPPRVRSMVCAKRLQSYRHSVSIEAPLCVTALLNGKVNNCMLWAGLAISQHDGVLTSQTLP